VAAKSAAVTILRVSLNWRRHRSSGLRPTADLFLQGRAACARPFFPGGGFAADPLSIGGAVFVFSLRLFVELFAVGRARLSLCIVLNSARATAFFCSELFCVLLVFSCVAFSMTHVASHFLLIPILDRDVLRECELRRAFVDIFALYPLRFSLS